MDAISEMLHVLLIYNEMIPSIRLCAYAQLEELSGQKILEFKAVRYINISRKDLQWADVVIMGRSDSWFEYILAKQAHKAGKYVAYILDDDLLNVPANLSSAAYLNRKDIRRNIHKTLEMSDILISPSPILLDKYAPKGSGRAQLLVEEPAILPAEYSPRESENPIRIGFAGSIDRANDIELILKEALLRIKAEYAEQVNFFFYGAIPSFSEELGAQTIAYCDTYELYRETLNSLHWDIGLAPMPQTDFHACKHYNKFVEYAASGIVGIYSETEPYIRLKKWHNCGLFCNNTSESWYRAIKTLLDDPYRLEAMRKQVCLHSTNELNVQTISEGFYAQLCRCVGRKKEVSAVYCTLAPYKVIHLAIRGFHFIQCHRNNLISAIWQKLKTKE